jgi:cysteine/O-acetylserine efflux protein
VTTSIIVITIIGFLAFMAWVLLGAIFNEVLKKQNKTVNLMMALSLAYVAIMIWM